MKAFTVTALLCLLLAPFAAGCGGGGGGSTPALVSPFAGSWTDSAGETINVDSHGRISAASMSLLNDGTPVNGTWTGSVGNGGALSGTFTITTSTQVLPLTVSGGSNLGSDAHWRGTLLVAYQSRQVGVSFDLTRQ